MHTGMHTWTETFQIWFVPRSRCSHVRAVQKIPLQTTNCTAASFQHMPLYPAGFEAEASAAGCHDRAARRPALIAACHQVTYSACKVTRHHLSPRPTSRRPAPPAPGETGVFLVSPVSPFVLRVLYHVVAVERSRDKGVHRARGI